MKLLIIDYGMGNIASVANAFQSMGCAAENSQDPKKLSDAQAIVLPGVGAFGDGMRALRTRGWVEGLEREVRGKGKPFLGLCLGMQLMGTTGEEHGNHDGLNWMAGRVRKLNSSLRLPHIGWNDIKIQKHGSLLEGITPATFYFVHSYVFEPIEKEIVTSICDYGESFAASVESDNLFGFQFHPEKSQKAGIQLLKNFLNKNKLC